MTTEQGLAHVYEALRESFRTWYDNDTEHPVTIDPDATTGGLCYAASTKAAATGSTVLGLVDKLDATDGVGVVQVAFDFGWDRRERQLVQGVGRAARVVMVPGDPQGDLGTPGPARQSGPQWAPRSLATLFESYTLYIWAADRSDKSALGQFIATRDLFNLVHAAMYRCARGSGPQAKPIFARQKWVNVASPSRLFGMEIEAVGTIESALPDSELATVAAPATLLSQAIQQRTVEA